MAELPLQEILKGVSRSFYLTLWVLPSRVRPQIGLAYLFCRAADTIADTDLIPASERLKYLELFRLQFQSDAIAWENISDIQNKVGPVQETDAEKILLNNLNQCFKTLSNLSPGDQERIRSLVTTLTNGMEMDLIRFPLSSPQTPIPLSKPEEMDQYIYYVAGIVGEFWTRMAIAHFPGWEGWSEKKMSPIGTRFGKGLQMTNILKDLSKDLERGRCYIPITLLDQFSLRPDDLLEPSAIPKVRPLLVPLIQLTLSHLEQGWDYIMAIPKGEVRLRLACLWPHLFAIKTLQEIYRSDNLLDPKATIKISRDEVYSTMIFTTFTVYSNSMLTRYYSRLVQKIKKTLPGV